MLLYSALKPLINTEMQKALVLAILFYATVVTAQAQDFLDTIAIQTCGCLEELASDSSLVLTEFQIGVCLLEEARPYSKQLLKDYQIDILSVESDGMSRLGEIVGMRMVTHCLELIMQFAKEDESGALMQIRGKLKEINKAEFTTLIVVDNSGRRYSLLWLSHFAGSDALLDQKTRVIGSDVVVEYEEQDFFDPRVQEYRVYKIIRSLGFE